MAYGRIYMEITDHAIHLLAEMERSVQDHYGDFADLAHGFEHVHRVYHLALPGEERDDRPDVRARSHGQDRRNHRNGLAQIFPSLPIGGLREDRKSVV